LNQLEICKKKKKKKKFYPGKLEGYQKCWACKQQTWIRYFTCIQVFLFKWNSWKEMNKSRGSRLLMHDTSPLYPKLHKNLRCKIEINVYNDWFRAAEKLSNASPVGIRECPIQSLSNIGSLQYSSWLKSCLCSLASQLFCSPLRLLHGGKTRCSN